MLTVTKIGPYSLVFSNQHNDSLRVDDLKIRPLFQVLEKSDVIEDENN